MSCYPGIMPQLPRWRYEQQIPRTRDRRPDLYETWEQGEGGGDRGSKEQWASKEIDFPMP